MRIRQYYKSVVIVLGMFFGGKIFTTLNFHLAIVLGFFLISLTSSSNYILNDLIDLKKDKIHPEKSKRPIASGEIKIPFAISLWIGIIIFVVFGSLYLMSLLIGQIQANYFALMLLIMIINGNLYNMVLKHEVFLDIISLSMMYLWRTWAGCIIVGVKFSPWLFLLVFELALTLAVFKRIADLELLGDKAAEHKKIYAKYDLGILRTLSNIVIIGLFMTYSMYCILAPTAKYSGPQLQNNQTLILFSIPVALYLILRFLYVIKSNPEIARKTEKAFFDKALVISGMVLVIIVYVSNYIELNIPF